MTEPEPLKITCTSSDCEADLHCFRPTRWKTPDPHPTCRDCGADLVEWERLHQRDFADYPFLFEELPKELIRHHCWHMDIPEHVLERTKRYHPEVIASRTKKAVRSRVAEPADEWDGTQTKMPESPEAQIYFMGMHATACCCRKCMQYWHGIPMDRELTEKELTYFASLVWLYVCQRMKWHGLGEVLIPQELLDRAGVDAENRREQERGDPSD